MLLSFSKSFLYLSLFSVVVVMTSTFFPFIGGKYYLFRVAVEFSLICFLLWWAFEAGSEEDMKLRASLRRLFSSPLFLAVSAFVLTYLLASIFAYDPHAAFWSNYERGEGGFQMLHYYVFFVLLVLLLKRWSDWRMVFYLSLGAAVLMILYGVGAAMNVPNLIGPSRGGDPTVSFWERLFSPRFQGSLGNPAYVAPYLMFSVFYALYLWFSSQWKKWWPPALFFGGLSVFFSLFFFLSQTRGAFLGIIAAALSFLLYLIFTLKKKKKWAVGLLLALIVLGGALFTFRNSPVIQTIPGSRVLHLGLGERTVQTRLWTWQSAWEGLKERPVFGWGPENFSTVFDKYFDPRHFVPGQNSETWFDRAHSVLFDYLAETGAVGLLTYASIFVIFFWGLFSLVRSRRGNVGEQIVSGLAESPVLQALVIGILVGYLVQALVLFDVLPIYINLFLLLAFGVAHFQFINRHEPNN